MNAIDIIEKIGLEPGTYPDELHFLLNTLDKLLKERSDDDEERNFYISLIPLRISGEKQYMLVKEMKELGITILDITYILDHYFLYRRTIIPNVKQMNIGTALLCCWKMKCISNKVR